MPPKRAPADTMPSANDATSPEYRARALAEAERLAALPKYAHLFDDSLPRPTGPKWN